MAQLRRLWPADVLELTAEHVRAALEFAAMREPRPAGEAAARSELVAHSRAHKRATCTRDHRSRFLGTTQVNLTGGLPSGPP